MIAFIVVRLELIRFTADFDTKIMPTITKMF